MHTSKHTPFQPNALTNLNAICVYPMLAYTIHTYIYIYIY